MFLCTGEAPAAAETVTPSGVRAILPIVRAEREEDSAVCGVQKDSGDDPDVTNGTLVCARAVLACHDSITESGYTDPAYPGIEVTGGEGIGMVTRDGLSCQPVAVFIVPASLPDFSISRATGRACRSYLCGLRFLSLPGGSWRRKRLTRIWGSSVVSRCLEQLGL